MLFPKKIKIVSVVIMCLLAVACKKDKQQDPNNNVPYTPVDITIYPNDPLYFKIQTPGGWVYITGGVRGIIVYRKTAEEFVALDRASTYYPDDASALAKVQSDSFTCKDTVSGSKWQIVDGAVISGPATLPLKKYNTTYQSGALRIFN